MLNSNIPYFKCYVQRRYFTKNPEHTDYDACYAFAIQSVSGKVLTFHILTDYGMLRSRVPLFEIYEHPPTNDIPCHFKQLWDCFSENVAVTEYSFLYNKRCQVMLKDGTLVWATYMFTVDWYENPYSEEPTDYKCGHVMYADDGYFLCQPNNRIYWKDSNFVTKPMPDPKQFKVDTEFLSIETFSDRWVSDDSDHYYYDLKHVDEKL